MYTAGYEAIMVPSATGEGMGNLLIFNENMSRDSSMEVVNSSEIFLQALAEIIEPSAMGPWLRTSNSAFEGSTPIQLFERGECDRLWRMIHDLNSGQPA